jgi:hypothetical protein
MMQDVSGGCGAMYDIFVESSIFKVWQYLFLNWPY